MRRIMFLTVAVAGLSALAAAPASAGPAAGSSDDGNRKVCKHQKSTTSRIPKKTCRVKADWEAISEQAKRAAAETINRPQVETRRE